MKYTFRTMQKKHYVHGYARRELARLRDQAETLQGLLHHDTKYPAGCKVLEVGCGIGAQTRILAGNSPRADITSIDISDESVRAAERLIRKEKKGNVRFRVADIYNLPFEKGSFDHVFICFVLEHLPDPAGALEKLRTVLKKGGSLTVIEGDHGSCYFYPESEAALKAWRCLIQAQAHLKGDSLIGRRLYPLLKVCGFRKIEVTPRVVYVDPSKPLLVEGFTKKTIIAMVNGVRSQAFDLKLIDRKTWRRGIRDLYKTAGKQGTFCYSFFKGVAVK